MSMSMDGAILPINFYCRNARLCLKKAALSKKSHLYNDELEHLRSFETLVLSTIPAHPLYSERKDEKHVLELHLHIQDAKKRITEIEESGATKEIKSKTRQADRINVERELHSHKRNENVSTPSTLSKRFGELRGAGGEIPVQSEGRKFKPQEETSIRAQKGIEGALTRTCQHQQQQRHSSDGRSTLVRAEGFRRPRARSADSTPHKKQRNKESTPRIVSEFKASWAASQPRGQKQHHQLHHHHQSSSSKDGPQGDNFDHSRMEDPYAFASKPAHHNRSKSTPILQRLRNVSDCLGGESPRQAKSKTATTTRATIKGSTFLREESPFRPKAQREMPRVKALDMVFSVMEVVGGAREGLAKAVSSTNASLDNTLPKQFGERLKTSDNLAQSEDDQEGSNTIPAGEKESSDTASTEIQNSQNSLSIERDNGGRLGEDDRSETMRQEAAWTTLRLQEQFGEALKELGTLQDRDEVEEIDVPTPEESFVRAQACKPHNGQQPSTQSASGGRGGNNGKGQKMHAWKLGAHVRGKHLQEIEEEQEAYFQRSRVGVDTPYYDEEGNDGSDQSARTSPMEPVQKITVKYNRDEDANDNKMHYGESADHLDLFTPPHSKDGSDNSRGCLIDSFQDVKEDCLKFHEHMRALKDTRIREIQMPPKFHDGETLGLHTSRDGPSRTKNRRPKEPKAEDARIGKGEILQEGISDQSNVIEEQPSTWSFHRLVAMDSIGKGGYSKKKSNPIKNNSEMNISPLSLLSASSTSSSSSSSSSSLSSLPLSQYLQKLKHLAPEPRFSRSSSRVFCNSLPYSTASKQQSLSKYPKTNSTVLRERHFHHHHHHLELDSSKTLDSAESVGASDAHQSGETASAVAIRLPQSPPTSQVALSPRIQQQLGQISKSRKKSSDQRLGTVLGGCALVQNHPQQNQDLPEGRPDIVKSRGVTNHKMGGGGGAGGHHHKNLDNLTSVGFDKVTCASLSHDLISYVSHKQDESNCKAGNLFDGSMANMQRLVGELKGSVEGFKIWMEVESEGWRGRVEGLEKEIETLKDETDDKLMELKNTIRSEVKARMNELVANVERIQKGEKDQVASLVEEKIGRNLSLAETTMGDLKKEIHSLWIEMESLNKGRKEMQAQMENLAQMSEDSRENTTRELRNLKRDVQGADERIEWKKDNEVERTERAEVRHALEKIKDEGLDMKIEVNGLKKAEKAVKIEMESMRKLVEKLQEDMEEMERDRGAVQMEGVRERLLIMERVESLSQLYLGGLEEVRTDVFNVKFSCRDRMDELESQWIEYKQQQENQFEGGHSSHQKQRCLSLNELELFRSEISDMMENERSQLRETFEREQENIQIQVAKDKVLSIADPIKKDMDRLKMDLHEAQQDAEVVAHALAMVEKERDLASQAAIDATTAAEKAREVLADLLGPISQDLTTTRHKCMALQDTIVLDRDTATHALGEAKKMHQDFQEFMQQEMIRLKTAISLVYKERDSAATAASEASTSAMKAGEVLAEVLGSFNQEMSKARRKSYQLQEGLDRERESLERDREEVIQKSQDAQEKFNEELERAILMWKRAMNQEVAKAKAVVDGLDEKQRQATAGIDQYSHTAALDHGHVARMQETLINLKAAVKQIQEAMESRQEEKQRHRAAKNDGRLWREQEQKIELNAMKLRIDETIKMEESLQMVVSESGKRMQNLEILQVNLAQSFEEVRATTGDLEKTARIWLPKYESAARILNEINCKVESLEEKCRNISMDEEGLMKKIANVVELKLQSLRDTMTGRAAADVSNLLKRVENDNEAKHQAFLLLETRLAELESTIMPEVQDLSLRVNIIVKKLEGDPNDMQHCNSMSQTLELLERRVELLVTARHPIVEPNLDFPSKLNGLESRIELVASATFTNLRLLDSKVEECTANVHQAIEGAATAESKCSALGLELVKVFRMMASSQQANQASITAGTATLTALAPVPPSRTRSPPSCGRNHSPTKINPAERSPSPPQNRSPLQRRSQIQASKSNPRKGLQQKSRSGDFARSTMTSEMRKATTKSGLELQEEYVLQESSSPMHNRVSTRDHHQVDAKALTIHQDDHFNKVAVGVGSEDAFMLDRSTSVQEGEIKGLGQLHISQAKAQAQIDDKQSDETSSSKCQRTNIHLEAGRIHVNVSHRSGVSTGSRDKRASDLIAVQS